MGFAKLGRDKKAERIFDQLIATGQQRLTEGAGIDFFAKFGEQETKEAHMADAHYIMGLGYLGNGQTDEAKAQFARTIELNVNHLWAGAQLSELK